MLQIAKNTNNIIIFNNRNSIVKFCKEGIYIAITEYSFSINQFNEPLTYENAKAVMAILTRLILLDPGTIQSHPDMGIGIVKRYRYSMEGSELELQSDIRSQIDRYLPQFRGAQVSVILRDHCYYAIIKLDSYSFSFVYNTETNELTENFANLENL